MTDEEFSDWGLEQLDLFWDDYYEDDWWDDLEDDSFDPREAI